MISWLKKFKQQGDHNFKAVFVVYETILFSDSNDPLFFENHKTDECSFKLYRSF